MKIHSIILAVMLTCLASLSSAASQRLTILHSNDVHGHLRPFSYPAIAARESRIMDLPAWRDIGGIARRAALAARIRADLAQLGTPVWLVDAGDFYYYSPFSIEYHGKADVVAMNAAGYDFATLGNHEFEDSLPRLREMIAAARFAFLCANVVDSAAASHSRKATKCARSERRASASSGWSRTRPPGIRLRSRASRSTTRSRWLRRSWRSCAAPGRRTSSS